MRGDALRENGPFYIKMQNAGRRASCAGKRGDSSQESSLVPVGGRREERGMRDDGRIVCSWAMGVNQQQRVIQKEACH